MRHTVLIVEDEEDAREMMRSLVELAGFDVVLAADGRAALAAMSRVENVCLVLLDLLMPVMNGWDFLDALRTSTSYANTPVIVTTSLPDKAPPGATLVLRKPLDPKEVLAEVRHYCSA